MTKRRGDTQLPKLDVEGSSPFARSLLSELELVSVDHAGEDEYFARPATSATMLKCLQNSSLEFYSRYEKGDSPSYSNASLTLGKAFHLRAEIGEEEWRARKIVAPASVCTSTGTLSTAGKGTAWLADQDPSACPVSIADDRLLDAMFANVLANPQVLQILAERTDAEFNLGWNWKGHACRCRVDLATCGYFADWKTTRDKYPLKTWWQAAIRDYHYDIQEAFYRVGGLAAGWPDAPMRFIVCSTTWPYEVAVVRLPDVLIRRARERCLQLLDELAARREWNQWSRNETAEVIELFVPPYILKEATNAAV